MKSNTKLMIIILITLEILFASASKITITDNNNVINSDNENLKISTVSGKIHIDDDNPSINWTVAKKDGICTGNGTYFNPYVIKDLEIDGEGSGSCILIDNSEVYFRIENCTLFNCGYDFYDAGIKLVNVNNGKVLNNNCSNNNIRGILLRNSNNSIISGNTVNNNNAYGIALYGSHNNTISGNTINEVSKGIILEGNLGGSNNIVSGNLMNECGLKLHGNLETLLSHEIDTTNLVNGKPVYYYTNRVNLRSYDFPNAGQLILVNCSGSLISNLNVSYTTIAISLHYCNNNIISGNTLNNNTYYGIKLASSDSNYISGNTANTNDGAGIFLVGSNNNNVSGNTVNYNHYYGGIYLYKCNNNTVSENIADNSKRFHGICIEYSNNNIISGNIVNNNKWSGIGLVSSDYNIISGNTANYNEECGILLHISYYNTISRNIANNNMYGIFLYFGSYNTISGNNLIGNDECIFELGGQGNVIQNNDCTLTPSLAYFPIILIISIPIVGVSVFIIYQNGKKFKKPQEDLDFL
ncbi:MAG: NosD domain-containing protein [Promethearchaeota archaeon]|jgi:parallel beta-helix repeat protein